MASGSCKTFCQSDDAALRRAGLHRMLQVTQVDRLFTRRAVWGVGDGGMWVLLFRDVSLPLVHVQAIARPCESFQHMDLQSNSMTSRAWF